MASDDEDKEGTCFPCQGAAGHGCWSEPRLAFTKRAGGGRCSFAGGGRGLVKDIFAEGLFWDPRVHVEQIGIFDIIHPAAAQCLGE